MREQEIKNYKTLNLLIKMELLYLDKKKMLIFRFVN